MLEKSCKKNKSENKSTNLIAHKLGNFNLNWELLNCFKLMAYFMKINFLVSHQLI